MNRKKARALRKYVYGDDMSKRDHRYVQAPMGFMTCVGLRFRYCRLKKMIRNGEHTVDTIIKGKIV